MAGNNSGPKRLRASGSGDEEETEVQIDKKKRTHEPIETQLARSIQVEWTSKEDF